MKQLKGAKRAEMLQDAANKGFDDVTVAILKSKTIFNQNLLLKGDTVEFEDFDIKLICFRAEFNGWDFKDFRKHVIRLSLIHI